MRLRCLAGSLVTRGAARRSDPSQIRYSVCRGGGGGRGGSRTITAVKTSPHPTTSLNPAGKCPRQDRAVGRQYRRLREPRQGTVVWVAFPSPVASDQGFLALSLCLSLCFSDRRMSGPGAWCLVMISPSRLKALAEQSRAEERGEQRRGEEERHRLHLAALTLSASPSFATFP